MVLYCCGSQICATRCDAASPQFVVVAVNLRILVQENVGMVDRLMLHAVCRPSATRLIASMNDECTSIR